MNIQNAPIWGVFGFNLWVMVSFRGWFPVIYKPEWYRQVIK